MLQLASGRWLILISADTVVSSLSRGLQVPGHSSEMLHEMQISVFSMKSEQKFWWTEFCQGAQSKTDYLLRSHPVLGHKLPVRRLRLSTAQMQIDTGNGWEVRPGPGRLHTGEMSDR